MSVKLSIYNQTVKNLKQASKMKKQVILFIAVFFSSQLLMAQATPTQKMEEFITQKGDGSINRMKAGIPSHLIPYSMNIS
ncbi:MAG: hypothetical protein ACKN9X_09295 [Candidatus Methylopumilus sp.]